MGERSKEAGSKFVVYDKEGRLLLSWVFPPLSFGLSRYAGNAEGDKRGGGEEEDRFS